MTSELSQTGIYASSSAADTNDVISASTQGPSLALLAAGTAALVASELAGIGLLSTGHALPFAPEARLLVSAVTRLAVLAALCFAALGAKRYLGFISQIVAGVFIAAGAVGSLLFPSGALSLLSACLLGAGGGCSAIVWISQLGSVSARADGRSFAIGGPVGIIVGCILIALGNPITAIGVAILGTLVALAPLNASSSLSFCAPDGALSGARVLDYPWFSLVVSLACCLVAGSMAGLSAPIASNGGSLAPAIAGIATLVLATIAAAAMALLDKSWIHRAFAPAFVALFCGLLLASSSNYQAIPTIHGIFVGTAASLLLIRLALVPAVLINAGAPRSAMASVLALATDPALIVLALSLGATVPATGLQDLYGAAAVSALVLVVLMLAGLVSARALSGYRVSLSAQVVSADMRRQALERALEHARAELADAQRREEDLTRRAELSESLIADQQNTADEEPAPEQSDALPTFDQAVDAIGEQYGLTARELEIARLTARGNSSGHIAEVLIISSSTVRFHQQNIYRKLDIHSRQDFINLVAQIMHSPSDEAPADTSLTGPTR